MKSIISGLAGVLVGAYAIKNREIKKKRKLQKMSDKHLALYMLMNCWVRVKQEGKNLSEYFRIKGYKTIAIYGMSYAGETLVEELKGTEITVLYGMDRELTSTDIGIEIVRMDEIKEDVDAIVVTAITYFDEIKNTLTEKVKCPVISLEEVLFEAQHIM